MSHRHPSPLLQRARLGALALAVPSCLALAACGSSDSSSSTSSFTQIKPQSTSTAAPSPTSSAAPSEATSSSSSSGGSASSTSATPSGSASTSGGSGPSGSASSGGKGGDAASRTTYTAAGWSQFTSPSGKNWCDMTSNASVGCRLSPALQAQHGGQMYVMLNASGVTFMSGDPGVDTDGAAAAWARGSGVGKRSGTAVLPYGSSIKGGSITCSSSQKGFTCTNGTASFTVSSTAVTTTGSVS